MPLISALKEAEAGQSELEVSLVYRKRPRTTRATHGYPLSKTNQTKYSRI